MPGVGAKTERRLWESGIETWDDLISRRPAHLPAAKVDRLRRAAEESLERLEADDAGYFHASLPSDQQWRVFPEFRHRAAFVDIETTGLGGPGDYITTIVLYDGQELKHYVRDDNLQDFVAEIDAYRVLVTYNGKCFDVPFIRDYFGIAVPHAHIDLRYVLASLGYRGGLKGCERQLGLDRQELADVDGFFAVLLWFDYLKNNNAHALETLLAYNAHDVVNLSTLMVMAYNMKVSTTPFADRLTLQDPPSVTIPFEAHSPTIERIQRQPGWPGFS
jgi:uncharacterized protein YprB with RNaseH-like and TPR domain